MARRSIIQFLLVLSVLSACSSGAQTVAGESTDATTTTTNDAVASTTTTPASSSTTSTTPSTTTTTTATAAETPNVLLLIADDLGVESSPCFAAPASLAPNLAAACAQGVVFDQAWSSPICSPTRAGMLTGRHSFRTGIGTGVSNDNGLILDPTEVTLPRALDRSGSGYATANFGKWHLGGDADYPNEMGWDHFSGILAGGFGNYSNWNQLTNGVTTSTTTYATTANVDGAIDWIDDQNGPWLTWIGFNAPHTPFHLPPDHLHSFDLSGDQADIDANPLPYYQAAIQALDTEIGRLLDNVDLENTVVIFIGDNGSPGQVSGYEQGRSKGSLAQGGVHVPMFAWGAGIDSGRRSDALVGSVDVFATVLDLAGVDTGSAAVGLPAIDSVSFLPQLRGSTGGARTLLLSEHFGDGVRGNQAGATIRNDRYKLTLFDNGRTWFADLDADPTGETLIRDASRTPAEDAIHDDLLAELTQWRSNPNAAPPG